MNDERIWHGIRVRERDIAHRFKVPSLNFFLWELFPSDLSMYNSELTLDPEINTENPSLTSDFK